MDDLLKQIPPVVMGPCVRRDDPLRDYALSLVAVDDGQLLGADDCDRGVALVASGG